MNSGITYSIFIKNSNYWSSQRILRNGQITMDGKSSFRKQAKFSHRILQFPMANEHHEHKNNINMTLTIY